MIADWGLSSEDIKIIAEAIFWLCLALMSPVIFKVAYYLTAPLWAALFPAKTVELQYRLEGKLYTATVDANSNLSTASTNLRLIAEKKAKEAK